MQVSKVVTMGNEADHASVEFLNVDSPVEVESGLMVVKLKLATPVSWPAS